jgi:carbamoyl-phosphate synthase small subunit
MYDFKSAKLILANGQVFDGFAPKWQSENSFGEVVFNTGMTGYEETLTDPSYLGQILTFTFPILGNYGVSGGRRWESHKIHVSGVICETLFNESHHYSAKKTFVDWLYEEKVPLLCGVDTRELTKVLREYGVLAGVITYGDSGITNFDDSMVNHWVKEVSPKSVEIIGNGKYKIILVDCGAKENIVRCLLNFDVTIKRVPFDYDYTLEEYDGVMLSNGPGDPKLCIATIEILSRALNKDKPVFGICLGSQLMALAIGANTYKLKYGHRGHNQPCIDLIRDRCYLTSQNHSYAVEERSLPADWQVTFRHLNDNTVAGISHVDKPYSAVQFHPEASSGPQDTFYLFEQFYEQILAGHNK